MRVFRKVVISMRTGEILEEDSYSYEGPLALAKGNSGAGGGGAAGTVDFPAYIKEVHSDLLAGTDPTGAGHTTITTDMVALLNTLISSTSPYTDATRPSSAKAYDPTSKLDATQTEVTAYKTEVSSLDEKTDWQSFVDTVVAKIDTSTVVPDPDAFKNLSTAISTALTEITTALASQPISDLVAAFEAQESSQFMRSVGRFSASMGMVGAYNSTFYAMGLALMEQEFSRRVDQFQAQVKLQAFDRLLDSLVRSHLTAVLNRLGFRDQFVADSVRVVTEALRSKLAGLSDLAKLQAEVNRMAIVALKEQNDFNLELDVKEALWDLEGFQYVANMLAAGPGGTVSAGPGKLSTGQSALGGALAGASIGAAFGPVGAGVGAIIGGIGGALFG